MLVKKGDWDHFEAYVGVPRTGKSVAALRRAKELGRTPAYIIAHDRDKKLAIKWPEGGDTNVIHYRSESDLFHGLRSQPGVVHAIDCDDAAEVIGVAKRISRRSLEVGGGDRGVPVVLLIDEAVAAKDMRPRSLSPLAMELVALRRHGHIATIFTTQVPQFVHYSLFACCTRLVIFRIKHERALAALREAGVDDETLDAVAQLSKEKHECIVFTDL